MQIRFLVIDDEGERDMLLGFPLHLTPTEHRLIYAIAKNEKADAALLQTLLSDGVSRANVAVHISSINRKAERISSRKLILFEKNAYSINENM